MNYTEQQCADLLRDRDEVLAELQALMLDGVAQAPAIANAKAREHLTHGAGRRLGVLRRSVERIFVLFPPSQLRPLDREVLADVQVYLHAFVVNLYGIFDNWAWAFLLRHDAVPRVGRRTNVDLFKAETQRLLPGTLRDYVTSPAIAQWHERYVKAYRDALVHRIPLYIPPAIWTKEDSRRYERLEAAKVACIRAQEWQRLDVVWNEQDGIGTACPLFQHEFSGDEAARPVYLHPQLLNDSKTVIEFGGRYLAEWHESPPVRT